MVAQFQLQVFGSPQLVRGGRSPVRFRTKKHLAVLLYLHFEARARSIPRDRLVDLLWPEVPPEKGRHSLSQALLAIRSLLGTGAVTGREQEVQLLAELPSDLSTLRQGHVATVRVAEPLQGLDDCAGAEFAHWVDGARVRLKAQARDALRAALQAARASGNLSETHLVAAALYDVDPLCSDAVYALAERALLDGDTVAAVRLLKDQVRRAQAELGTNPNPEITRLLRQLERGDRPTFLAQTSPLPERLTRPHPFVAREVELGQLEAIWNRVVSGAGYHTCLITGAPGIGKSSLIRRFATSLGARAWPVFMVPCQEIGQGIPYATVSELITGLGRDPAAGGTAPLWLAEASRVCPGLRTIYPGIPQAPDAPTDSIRLRVAEAVVRMMEAVADNGPVLLAFDDLQFLDPASREVLFLITRRLERMPTLILAGARAAEAESGPEETGRGGLVWEEAIQLQPLERSEALNLIRDLSADSEDVSSRIRDTIVRLAQGNPYHIEMLLVDWRTHQAKSLVAAESSGDARAISWTPPEDLRAAFARQYGGLSTDAQHVLQILSVAGKAMAPSDLANSLGLQGGVVEQAALEMLDRGVGRVEEGRLSFKNELHRAYVYHAMGEDRRKYHHAQLAQRLAGAHDRSHLQPMLELVHHFICAGMQPQAMETALQAAEVAIAQGAPREAERVLTRLLQAYVVAPDSRLRLLLAHSLVAAGQYQRGLDALADWQPDAASSTDLALAALLRAEARARLGGDGATIIAAANEAVALAERAKAASFLARANYLRLEVILDAGDLEARAEAESLAARIAASSATPESVALANLTVGYGALSRGDFIQGVERLTAAAPILESLALLVELRRALNNLAMCYKGLGRFEDATRTLSEAVAVAERCGHPGAIAQSRFSLANQYQDLAFFDSFVRCVRAALAPLQALSSPRASVEAYSSIARFALVLASVPEAEKAMERCEQAAQRSGLWRHKVTALMTRAEIHLCRGQPDLAWPLVEEAAIITGDRSHILPEAGLYERLQRQFCWATRGYEVMKSLARPVPTALYDSLGEALEVRLFDEAAARIAGDQRERRAPALEEAVTTGLLGPLARLLAVGIHHPAVPDRLEGESAAQLVARVFPHPERTVVPRSVGLLATSDEPSDVASE